MLQHSPEDKGTSLLKAPLLHSDHQTEVVAALLRRHHMCWVRSTFSLLVLVRKKGCRMVAAGRWGSVYPF